MRRGAKCNDAYRLPGEKRSIQKVNSYRLLHQKMRRSNILKILSSSYQERSQSCSPSEWLICYRKTLLRFNSNDLPFCSCSEKCGMAHRFSCAALWRRWPQDWVSVLNMHCVFYHSQTYHFYSNKRRGAYLKIVSDKFTFSIFFFNCTLSIC